MNPLRHPAAHQIPEKDVEKRGEFKDSSVNLSSSDSSNNSLEDSQNISHPATSDVAPTPILLRGRLARWNAKVEGLAGLGTYLPTTLSSFAPGLESWRNVLGSNIISTRFEAGYAAVPY